MRTPYNPNQSPRVIIIQKLYGKFFNDDADITFAKHRFKKFIKDVVLGAIERDEVIKEEVKNHLSDDLELTNLVWEYSRKKFDASKYSLMIILVEILGL